MKKTTGTLQEVDPFRTYLGGLLSDLESHSYRKSGSAAICLGAFARLGRLGRQVPRVVHALAHAIYSGGLDEVDLWLCSTALKTVVSSKPAECQQCTATLHRLLRHDNDFVAEDAAAALSSLGP